MTGGVVAIIGSVGDNFAAGMTGGMAFVYDAYGDFEHRVNPDSVVWQRIHSSYWEQLLVRLVEEHVAETTSAYARRMLNNWDREWKKFWQICPKEMLPRLKHPLNDDEAAEVRA
jgi:glutamate synthase (NADPH/NADH) large chain